MLSIFSCVCMASFERCLFISSAHYWLCCSFLILSCMSHLYILDINPFSVISFANIFSHFVVWLFIFLMVFIAVQRLKLLRSHLVLLLFLLPYKINQKKFLQFMPRSVQRMFSPRSFRVWGITFRSLIHLEYFCVWCEEMF